MVIPDIESVNYGRGVGCEINEYQPPKIVGMFISATKIIKSKKNGDNSWKKMVHESIHDEIQSYLN